MGMRLGYADRTEGPAAPAVPDTGPLIDLWAKIGIRLESLTAELEQQRAERQQLFQDVRFVPVNAQQAPFASLPYAFNVTVKGGFTWAVQRISVAGFASATDLLTIYRGANPADAVPQNQLQVMSESLYTWHPGRTGLLLKPNQTIVLGGGTTGSTYTVNMDVIQVSDAQLPFFLL